MNSLPPDYCADAGDDVDMKPFANSNLHVSFQVTLFICVGIVYCDRYYNKIAAERMMHIHC